MFMNTDFLFDGEIKLQLEKTVNADPEREWLPAYHFAICDMSGQKMGTCDFRVGHNMKVYYGGNIGYKIDEEFRGHRYAAKACKLIFELAKKHDLGYVLITCNPNNGASRRTCESLGGELLEIVELPLDSEMRALGEDVMCVFRFNLT